MSFNRAYEFERSDFGPSESNELQDSFEKNLSKKSTTSISDQIQSSLTRVNYMNHKKTTVAEMVADLIERTGLEAYQKEVQAAEEKEKATKKIATKTDIKEITMDGVSLLDIPGVQEAITGYIKRYNAFQLEPVLNFIMEEITPTLIENNDGSLGEIEHVNEVLGKDYHSEDPRLKIFITENLLNGQNKSLKDFTGHNTPVRMDDGVFDILTPSSKY
ncbi:MAG TPA: hypothetical protein VMX17_13315 [Candidatus Glassbacteria bacterium]|nr:hypothetical protein [Candidatus Glassbacteria bacterium]